MPNMQNSDDEERSNRDSRSRSRSPLPRRDDYEIDLENLSPQSRKFKKIVDEVVAVQLAPIKKNINKLMETSSQVNIKIYSISWF